jgi:hypothetical protein
MAVFVFVFDVDGVLRIFRSLDEAADWATTSDLVSRGHLGVFLADGTVVVPRDLDGRVVLTPGSKIALDRLVYRLAEYQRRVPSVPAIVDPESFAVAWLANS